MEQKSKDVEEIKAAFTKLSELRHTRAEEAEARLKSIADERLSGSFSFRSLRQRVVTDGVIALQLLKIRSPCTRKKQTRFGQRTPLYRTKRSLPLERKQLKHRTLASKNSNSCTRRLWRRWRSWGKKRKRGNLIGETSWS